MSLSERWSTVKDAFVRMPVPARAVLGAISASLVLALLIVFMRLMFWWASSGQATAKLEPRIAQTLGFLEAKEEIARSLASRTTMLAEVAFRDSGGSGRGGALLQQEIRKLAASSGLTVIGSEVQEPELLEDAARLRVNVKTSGLPGSVIRFLQSLDAYRPFLFVSSVSINPQQRQLNVLRSPGRETYDNTLLVELDVYAYQLGSME